MPKSLKRSFIAAVIAGLLGVAFSVVPASAATITWTGNGTDGGLCSTVYDVSNPQPGDPAVPDGIVLQPGDQVWQFNLTSPLDEPHDINATFSNPASSVANQGPGEVTGVVKFFVFSGAGAKLEDADARNGDGPPPPSSNLIVSHCWVSPETQQASITVEKTADGTFTRTCTWDVDKALAEGQEPAITIKEGESTTVNYEVVVTAVCEDDGHTVSGSIKISNTGDVDVEITDVTDSLGDLADLDCGEFTLGDTLLAGEYVDCSYTVAVENEAETNTATVSWEVEGEAQEPESSAPAQIAWTVGEIVDECVDLDDTLYGDLSEFGPFCVDGDNDEDEDAKEALFTINYSFTTEAYDECGNYTVDNTATVYRQDDDKTALDSDDESVAVTVLCFQGETAWAANDNKAGTNRYVPRGNWATYVDYKYGLQGGCTTLFAGQTINVGTVCFSDVGGGNVTITVTLTGGWEFADVGDNLKVQDYSGTPPASNPAPGKFAHKESCDTDDDSCTITVPLNKFYGVHVDVGIWVLP